MKDVGVERMGQTQENQFYRKDIAFDKIGGNYALPANSIKSILIRVFLHVEFISAMKTIQIPTIFVKNARRKKNRKMNNFGNFC